MEKLHPKKLPNNRYLGKTQLGYGKEGEESERHIFKGSRGLHWGGGGWSKKKVTLKNHEILNRGRGGKG